MGDCAHHLAEDANSARWQPGLFFAVWPSFTQQPIAMMYGHFFIVLDCFLASLWLNLKALDHPRSRRCGGYWPDCRWLPST